MGGESWLAGDLVTEADANQKTRIIDTAANIAAITPAEGQRARPTTSGNGLIANEEYVGVSGVWTHVAIENDIEVYPHSTTIGDYSQPSAATASSDTTTHFDTTARQVSNYLVSAFSGNKQRVGMKITASSALIGKKVNRLKVVLAKNDAGSGGTATIEHRNSSDTVLATLASFDIASLTTSAATQTYDFTEITLSSGDKIVIVNTGGDSANALKVFHDTDSGSGYDGTNTHQVYYQSAAYTDETTKDVAMALQSYYPASNAVDNSTSTKAETVSEVNPWVRVDISALAEPSAIAIYPHANTTATQIKIQTSPDGSTWTDSRLINVSALTMAAWNYIRLNRPIAQIRYLRIYGNDGSARVLAISEVKALIPTESQWNRRHGHKKISATEASLGLSG